MKNWTTRNNLYYLRDITGVIPKLNKGIYRLEIDPTTDEFVLAYVQDKFEFNYKIYNKDNKFVERVKKTYSNTTNNLGILLNGIKGTGKTVTAEMICNTLELPVIIVNRYYNNMDSFFNDIQEDVIIFFDEFEKLFDKTKLGDNAGADILSIMDGVLNGISRKVFLLTTNDKNINVNLVDRPSRIRYLKEYGNLDVDTIIEIIDDKLVEKQFRDETIKFISQLGLITIDIVKTVVEEINIHKESPFEFLDFMNVKLLQRKVSITRIEEDRNGQEKTTIIAWSAIVPDMFYDTENAADWVGYDLTYKKNDRYSFNTIGTIKKVIDHQHVVINVYDGEDEKGYDCYKDVIYKLEEVEEYHSSFKNYKLTV